MSLAPGWVFDLGLRRLELACGFHITCFWPIWNRKHWYLRIFQFKVIPPWICLMKVLSGSHSVISDSLWPHRLYSPRNSPGKNTGVGRLSLLQGIFLTPELNQGLLHCTWVLYQLSYPGSPTQASNPSRVVSSNFKGFFMFYFLPNLFTASYCLIFRATWWAIKFRIFAFISWLVSPSERYQFPW